MSLFKVFPAIITIVSIFVQFKQHHEIKKGNTYTCTFWRQHGRRSLLFRSEYRRMAYNTALLAGASRGCLWHHALQPIPQLGTLSVGQVRPSHPVSCVCYRSVFDHV